MARKVFSINMEVETVEAIDELAKKMNVSRSDVVQLVMSAAVQDKSISDFYKSLYQIWRKNEEEEETKGSHVFA